MEGQEGREELAGGCVQHWGRVKDAKELGTWTNELSTLHVLFLGTLNASRPQGESVAHSSPSTRWASGDSFLSHRITRLCCQPASPSEAETEADQHHAFHRDKNPTIHS